MCSRSAARDRAVGDRPGGVRRGRRFLRYLEIESSQIALEKASGEEVRAFAEQMAEDYTAAGEKMKAAAQEDGNSPPTSMTEKEQSQLEQLQSEGGGSFEEAYLSERARTLAAASAEIGPK